MHLARFEFESPVVSGERGRLEMAEVDLLSGDMTEGIWRDKARGARGRRLVEVIVEYKQEDDCTETSLYIGCYRWM